MGVKYVIDLMKAISENGFTEFEMEHGELRLFMKRGKIDSESVPGVSLIEKNTEADLLEEINLMA